MRRTEPSPTAGPGDAVVAGIDEALTHIERGLDQLAALDPSSLPGGCVTDAVRRLGRADGRIDGLQARLVRAAEAAKLPERSGASSTTGWLADTTRRSFGQAARTGRLAKATETNPRLADEVARGRVGPDQAATIAAGLDRGTIDPADADDLLDNATHLPPSAFSREAQRTAARRHQRRLRTDEQAAHKARFVDTRRLDDGSLAFNGQVPKAAGDAVETMLQGFITPDGADVPDDQRRTPRQLRADALAAAAEAALAAGASGNVGGVRPHVSVVVPLEAMAALRDAEDAGAIATSELGTVLSSAAFKALACDATFRRVVIDPDGIPLDVGRATRSWSPSIRAAIAAVDGGCRGPCCDGLPPHRCIVHHVRYWEHGGATSVANGVLLCNRGHDLVHVEDWDLAMDPTTRTCTWTSPNGDVVVTEPFGPSTTTAVRDVVADASTDATAGAAGPDAEQDAAEADAATEPSVGVTAAADRDRPPHTRLDPTTLQFDLGP